MVSFEPPRPTPVILVVESESVGNLIDVVLEKAGYHVLAAEVTAARQALRDSVIDLLITNEPWWFEPFAPDLRVLYIAGAPDREFLQRHDPARVAFLQKPFRFQNLLLTVHLLLQDVAKTV